MLYKIHLEVKNLRFFQKSIVNFDTGFFRTSQKFCKTNAEVNAKLTYFVRKKHCRIKLAVWKILS